MIVRKLRYKGSNMRPRPAVALGLLLFALAPRAVAQTVNGDLNAAFATGKWKESNEGVVLNCVRVTTQKEVIKGNSEGMCPATRSLSHLGTNIIYRQLPTFTRTKMVTKLPVPPLAQLSLYFVSLLTLTPIR